MTRLALFGGADFASPRARVLLEGLSELGVPCRDLRVERRQGVARRWRQLYQRLAVSPERPDWLLVPEFAHKDVPLAWLLARRDGLRVAFDPLVSRYDTLVEDWELYPRGGWEAWWNRVVDAWALSHADLVACDTAAHGERFHELGAGRTRLVRVPLGAESAYWQQGERLAAPASPGRAPGPLRVLYVGGFLPFHGVPVIVEAARRLAAQGLAEAIRFRLVGDGVQHERVRSDLAPAPLPGLELVGRRPQEELTAHLAAADVSLGCFADRPKTQLVVPHKVVQALAAGVCVVTAETRAMRESFAAGEHYVGVPPGDAEALARALAALAADPGRRVAVARAGRERARSERTPVAVARAWLAALEGPRGGRA